jgi:hypothetical protein
MFGELPSRLSEISFAAVSPFTVSVPLLTCAVVAADAVAVQRPSVAIRAAVASVAKPPPLRSELVMSIYPLCGNPRRQRISRRARLSCGIDHFEAVHGVASTPSDQS